MTTKHFMTIKQIELDIHTDLTSLNLTADDRYCVLLCMPEVCVIS